MGGNTTTTGVSWNRCFLCSSPVVPVVVEERGNWIHGNGNNNNNNNDDVLQGRRRTRGGGEGQHHHHQKCHQFGGDSGGGGGVKLLMKYLLQDFKCEEGSLAADVIGQWRDGGKDDNDDDDISGGEPVGGGTTLEDDGFAAKVCPHCRKLVNSLMRLQLELERIQMRIVSQVEVVKKAVISNSRLYGRNVGVRQDFEELEERLSQREADGGDCSSGRKFLDLIHHFQTFVFENEGCDVHIPFVYLERLTGKRMSLALMSHGLRLGSAGLNHKINIKEEPQDYFELMEEETELGFDELEGQGPPEFKFQDQCPSSARSRRGRKSTHLASTRRLLKQSLKVRKCDEKASEPRVVSQAQLLYRRLMKERYKEKWAGRRLKHSHKTPKEFTCEECGLKLNGTTSYQHEQHLREHETPEEEKNYECPECNKGFKQKQYFELHLPLHWRTRQCEVCPERVICLQMESHLRTHQEKVFACDFCTTWTASFEALANHLSSGHHSKKKVSVKCELCPASDSKTYQASSELRRHLAEAHGKSQFETRCSFEGCSELFYSVSALKAHLRVHSGLYSCSACDKSYSSAESLDKHVRSEHPEQVTRWYLCDTAGAGPSSSSSSCQEKFLTEAALLRHQIASHGKPKLKCELCPSEFVNKSTLASHLRVKHGMGKAPKKFICSHCGVSISSKTRWRTHEASHTREKNFTCEICGFATHAQEWLKKHKKKKHDESRERRFLCPHCPDSFFDSYSLKLHIRRHTGDRPYQCDECGSTFNQISSLNVHRRKHGGAEGKGFVPRGPRSNSSKKSNSALPENSEAAGTDEVPSSSSSSSSNMPGLFRVPPQVALLSSSALLGSNPPSFVLPLADPDFKLEVKVNPDDAVFGLRNY